MSLTFGGRSVDALRAAHDGCGAAERVWLDACETIEALEAVQRDLMRYHAWLEANKNDDRYLERLAFKRQECRRRWELTMRFQRQAEAFGRAAAHCDDLGRIARDAVHGAVGLWQRLGDAVPGFVLAGECPVEDEEFPF